MLGAIAFPSVQQAYCMHPKSLLSHTTEWDRAEYVELGAAKAAIVLRITTCGVCGRIWSR